MRLRRSMLLAVVLLVGLCRQADAAGLMLAAALQAGPNNAGVLTLDFSQIPQFAVAGQGSTEVTITFPDAQAPRLPVLQGAGIVRGVDFVPTGPGLVVRLHLADAAGVTANRAGARLIFVVAGVQAPVRAPVPTAAPVASPPPSAGRRTIEVIPLKYADVSEIVGILVAGQQISPNDTFVPQPSSLGTPNFSGGGLYGTVGGFPQTGAFPSNAFQTGTQSGGQSQSVGQRISDTIAIDRRLNAVILIGTPAELAETREMIARLDVPLPSVLLETQIVELTDSAAKNAGIDFTSNGVLANGQLSAKSGGPPQGVLNLQAAIYDEVRRGGGRILARPQIVAQSGASASILTGDALPIITAITFAGSSPVVQQQVQYINIGVNLQIQPRISRDGFVTSHIYSEVSSVTGYVQSYPQISQRVATTSATVRDGEAFVIGGLIQENELNSFAKIPGLGDLPLIGGFFRHRNDQRTRTNLYIVVTPRIVAPSANAAPAAPPASPAP